MLSWCSNSSRRSGRSTMIAAAPGDDSCRYPRRGERRRIPGQGEPGHQGMAVEQLTGQPLIQRVPLGEQGFHRLHDHPERAVVLAPVPGQSGGLRRWARADRGSTGSASRRTVSASDRRHRTTSRPCAVQPLGASFLPDGLYRTGQPSHPTSTTPARHWARHPLCLRTIHRRAAPRSAYADLRSSRTALAH